MFSPRFFNPVSVFAETVKISVFTSLSVEMKGTASVKH